MILWLIVIAISSFQITIGEICEYSDKQQFISGIIKGVKNILQKLSHSVDHIETLKTLSDIIKRIAVNYADVEAYTDILLKGFESMTMSDNQNGVEYNQYRRINSIIKDKSDPNMSLIEEIIQKLEILAESYKVNVVDALEIVKDRIIEAIQKKLSIVDNFDENQYLPSENNNSITERINYDQNLFTVSNASIADSSMEIVQNITAFTIVTTSLRQNICTPKYCACLDAISKYNDCKGICDGVCSNRHKLHNWICKAVNNSISVPLNFICDGIIDCIDESDENECNFKSDKNMHFEATKIFKALLEPYSKAALEKRHTYLRHKIRILYENIIVLQKNKNLNLSEINVQIVNLRDDVIQELVSVYDSFTKEQNEEELKKSYEYLSATKLSLINALKKVSIGNKRLVQEGQCLCRDTECAVPQCPKKCQTICTTLPLLARYNCKNSGIPETYIPLKSLCDGKGDCPRLTDEINCVKEPCRSHHMVVLRHRLQEFQKTFTGTRSKEIIKLWITKISEKWIQLEKLDKNENRNILKNITTDALMDLVLEYAALLDSARGNPIADFQKVAQIIVEARKSCDVQ